MIRPERLLWVALVLAGCGRDEAPPPSRSNVPIPLRIAADTGRTTPLAIRPAETARAWIRRVSRAAPPPVAVTPAPAGEIMPPPPAAAVESLVLESESTPTLVVGEDLKPPIPRGAAVLRLPPGGRQDRVVDLDVRVDESGAVSDALWAGGSSDSAAVHAAIECALAMRFYPALQAGRPVPVWCRQRFEFVRSAARPVQD